MIPFLKQRAGHLAEYMEDPDCDRNELFNTYRQFYHVNGLISRWEFLFDAWIAPLVKPGRDLHILDIGCGGGDLCLRFSSRAAERNLRIRITGIDPDPRAMEFVETLDLPENVRFRKDRASGLIRYGEKYDVVVSNHLLHHLDREEIHQLCKEAELLARQKVIFNDIRRSKAGFAAFAAVAPWMYRSSFIVHDGLVSIRRSFTKPELQSIVPSGWEVKKLFPYRLLALFDPG